MGREDLGTCVILSHNDLASLKINNLSTFLEQLGKFSTPQVPIFSTRKANTKLRKKIEALARKKGADVALITSQLDTYGFLSSGRSYDFELYQYKTL